MSSHCEQPRVSTHLCARRLNGSVDPMNKNLRVGFGVLLVLMGLIWTLQGVDVLKGSSVMSGKPLWAVIGPIVAIIGVLVAARALRAQQPK